MKRTILHSAILLPSCILIGFLLLSLMYLIPESAMHGTLSSSYDQIAAEETYPLDAFSGRSLDNFSDALIMLECGYTGTETPFVKAANSPFYEVNGMDPHSSVGLINQAAPEQLTLNNYSRFWHGYQVWLRPLLLIFNYQQIRVLNTVILFSLLALILFLMIRKAPVCALPFVLSVLFLAPTAVGQNIHFSGAVYVSLLTMLLILWNPKQIRNKGKIEILFLLSGIIVVFLDLITAPTIALTFPLALLCFVDRDDPHPFQRILRCTLFWGLGYAVMWFGKWVIAYIVNGPSFLDSLIYQMKFRSGNTVGFSLADRIRPLSLNIRHLGNTLWLNITVLLYLGGCIIFYILKGQKNLRLNLKTILPFVLVAFIPLVWTILLSNHSEIHVFFAYRTLVPCVFCVLCACGLLASPRKDIPVPAADL